MRLRITRDVLNKTFKHFRTCGAGRRECQALWVGPWAHPDAVTHVIHPRHAASAVGFQVDPVWLDAFWLELADRSEGVRAQVHTHPGPAYHSATDDAFPLLHTEGFLSLVIPNFAMGPIGFEKAFLAELGDDGAWKEVRVCDRIEVTP